MYVSVCGACVVCVDACVCSACMRGTCCRGAVHAARVCVCMCTCVCAFVRACVFTTDHSQCNRTTKSIRRYSLHRRSSYVDNKSKGQQC